MSKRHHIRAVSEGQHGEDQPSPLVEDEGAEAAEELEPAYELEEEFLEETPVKHRFGWVIPLLFGMLMAGWTGFYAWVHRSELAANPAPEQWIEWIGEWAVPMVLIVALWLLWMRSSSREAARFGDAAALLSTEAQNLEMRLQVINRELSLAREFLTSQSQDLDYLGRSASEKISEHADRLQSLIHDNGTQVDTIATVSASAMENMEKLRDNMPVIANSAKDVSNQIGTAGRTARENLDELIDGFGRLNDFGKASEAQVSALKDRIDSTLAEFDSRLGEIEGHAAARFDAMRKDSDDFRVELDGREVDALAAIRRRMATVREELETANATLGEQEAEALGNLEARLATLRDDAAETTGQVARGEQQALDAWSDRIAEMRSRLEDAVDEIARLDHQSIEGSRRMIRALMEETREIDERLAEREQTFDVALDERRNRLQAVENDALDSLTGRIAQLDAQFAAQRDAQLEHLNSLSEQADAIAARVGDLGGEIDKAAEQSGQAGGELAANVEALRQRITESRAALDGTGQQVSSLTEDCVRLLELIQASAKHTKEDLPESIEAFEERLGNAETRTNALSETITETGTTTSRIAETAENVLESCRDAIVVLESFGNGLNETAGLQERTLNELGERLATLDRKNTDVASRAREELTAAIAELETRARAAVNAIADEQAANISDLAQKVGDAAAQAIDESVKKRAAEAIDSLDSASERASSSSREAAMLLTDQLAKVNELATNLENRVDRAREKAQENVDNDFSRRVALITEALKSNAIDIGKALSTDVSDTAWTSYLRGDRGIFSRRAVRLLSTVEAREIAEIYDADPDFREHVSRYIHDFESMLRTLLSTRDGHALGVTVLSSDIGKLYVALAQGIERLRA